jgi:hypothetical protein
MSVKTKAMSITQRPVRRGVAVALATGLLIVVAFQAALTFGAPWGAAAQGGTNPGRLPDDLRLASGIAAIMFLLAALIVLAEGGRNRAHLPPVVVRVGTWVIVVLLGVGVLMNVASSSPWERYGWGPFTLVLFFLSVLLVRGGSPNPQAQRSSSQQLASRRRKGEMRD